MHISKTKLFSFLTASSILTACYATAVQDDGYRLVVANGCETPVVHNLNQAQVDALLALQQASEKMDVIEEPLDGFEEKMERLEERLNVHALSLKRKDLDEYRKLAEGFRALAAEYQGDLDSLQEQAEVVRQRADTFTQSIDGLLDDKHKSVEILEPGESVPDYCAQSTAKDFF